MFARICLLALLLCSLASGLRAQTVHQPAERAQAVLDAAQLCSAAFEKRDEAAAESARNELGAALERLAEDSSGVGLEDFNACALVLYRIRLYEECVLLCTTGIAAVSEPIGLNDYLGMSQFVLGQLSVTGPEMRRHVSAAVDAYLAARALGKPTEPAHLFLSLAYSTLGEFELALEDFDAVRESGLFEESFNATPTHTRGMFLLGAGRFVEAAETLASEAAATERPDRVDSAILVRSLALAGQNEEAVLRARRAYDEQASEITLAALVDVLAHGGETEEALALSKATPLMADAADEADYADAGKSRAVLEYLIGLDGKRPADLRARLTELTDHHMVVMGVPGVDGNDLDLAASPLGMGLLLRQVPFGRASWANDALFLLCVEDAPGYTPEGIEASLMKNMLDDETRAALTGEGAPDVALRNLRVHRVMPNSSAVLALERLIE